MTIAREVVRRLTAGVGLDGLGLSRVGGRWDLRGLSFSVATTRPVRVAGLDAMEVAGHDDLTGVRLEGLDLTGADWPFLRLRGCVVSDCVFDSARLPALICSDTEVRESSFVGADLRDAMMTGASSLIRSRNSSWTDVDFTRCDLRGSGHISETYTGCSFDRAKLHDVDFQGARHIGSRFTGRLEDVFFWARAKRSRHSGPDNTMQDVDLRDAELVGCSFWGLELRTALLPHSPVHVITQPKVGTARRVLDHLRRHDLVEELIDLRVLAEYQIKEGPDTEAARGILHHELLGCTDAERQKALQVLAEIQGGRP